MKIQEPPEQHKIQLQLLNICDGSIQTQYSALVAALALSFLKIATTCKLIMERHYRPGVAASATRVLVVASSAGTVMIGFDGTVNFRVAREREGESECCGSSAKIVMIGFDGTVNFERERRERESARERETFLRYSVMVFREERETLIRYFDIVS